MGQTKTGIEVQNRQGRPVQVGAFKLTPESQSISIRLPFWGFVYNRPVAVLVERDGTVDRIPVVDVTRMVLLGLAGFSFFFTLALSRRAKRSPVGRAK